MPWIDGRNPAQLAISESTVPNQVPSNPGARAIDMEEQDSRQQSPSPLSTMDLWRPCIHPPFGMRHYLTLCGQTRRILHVEKKKGRARLTPADGFWGCSRRAKFSASIGHRSRQKLHLGSPSRLVAASDPITGPPNLPH